MLRKDTKRLLAASVSPEQSAKFNVMATEWRNPHGAFKVVHAFNAARLQWLFNALNLPQTPQNVLDVGCATGLVAEAFAQQGHTVMGIDVAERNILLARTCAANAGLGITYTLAAPEDLAATTPQTYNIVLALEVVEHVENLESFLNAVFRCAHPQGTVVIATLNRTWQSWLIGIVVAEYVLRWLPKGTHSWQHFVTPAQLAKAAAQHGFQPVAQTGFTFNPLRWRWQTTSSLAVNYMQLFKKM